MAFIVSQHPGCRYGLFLYSYENIIPKTRQGAIRNFVTVQPLHLNSVEEPTPGPSQEENIESPLLGGNLGVGKLLQKIYETDPLCCPNCDGEIHPVRYCAVTDVLIL